MISDQQLIDLLHDAFLEDDATLIGSVGTIASSIDAGTLYLGSGGANENLFYSVPLSIARLRAGIDRINAAKAVDGLRAITDRMRAAIDGPPPAGYGAIVLVENDTKPAWLDDWEVVARHLPMGLSERKAGYVTTWDRPFRLRSDHPHYANT